MIIINMTKKRIWDNEKNKWESDYEIDYGIAPHCHICFQDAFEFILINEKYRLCEKCFLDKGDEKEND